VDLQIKTHLESAPVQQILQPQSDKYT